MSKSIPVHVRRSLVVGGSMRTRYRVLTKHCPCNDQQAIIARFADAGLSPFHPHVVEEEIESGIITATQDDTLLPLQRIEFLDFLYLNNRNRSTKRFDSKIHRIVDSEVYAGWLVQTWEFDPDVEPVDQAQHDERTQRAIEIAAERASRKVKAYAERMTDTVKNNAGSIPDPAPSQGGVKFDQGKRRYSLIPTAFLQDMADIMAEDPTLPLHLINKEFIRDIARVLKHGAEKYGERNWEKGMAWSRPYDASKRHLTDGFWVGEDCDHETGILHTAHAACNDMFLHVFQLRGIGTDDRPKEDSQ